jgi:hypothetical protein
MTDGHDEREASTAEGRSASTGPSAAESALPPEPENTGVRAEQREPEPDESAAIVRAAELVPAGSGIVEVDGTVPAVIQHLRRLSGSEFVIPALLPLEGFTRRVEQELTEAKVSRDAAIQRGEDLTQKLHNEQTTNAVLNERLKAGKQGQLVRDVLITLGGLAVGYEPQGMLGGLGIALLVIAWVWALVARD